MPTKILRNDRIHLSSICNRIDQLSERKEDETKQILDKKRRHHIVSIRIQLFPPRNLRNQKFWGKKNKKKENQEASNDWGVTQDSKTTAGNPSIEYSPTILIII